MLYAERARAGSSFDRDVFLFRNLGLRGLLRDAQLQDTVLKLRGDIFFGERIAHVEASAHGTAVALFADIAALLVFLVLVQVLRCADGQDTLMKFGFDVFLLEARQPSSRSAIGISMQWLSNIHGTPPW